MGSNQAGRRQSNVALFAETERALRIALNPQDHPPEPPQEEPLQFKVIRPPVRHRPSRPPKLTMRFSVREQWGGKRFVVSYCESSISEFEVRTKAERDMTSKQYVEVIHLDTVRS